jgi:hypothetical protein
MRCIATVNTGDEVSSPKGPRALESSTRAMSKLPDNLNTYLTALSLIGTGYAGFQWYHGGGIVWRFFVGLFGYLFLAGVWQAWVHRRK